MPTIAQRYDPAFPIDDLVEHPDNPRRGDEEAIAESMEAHGFYGAVIVQASTRRIIAGNHRTRVARRRGETTIPVLMLDVDDDQARRLLLVDNRTNDTAYYSNTELTALLEQLAASDSGLAGTGFDDVELAKLLKRWGRRGDPDKVPAASARVITEPGDLWILGRHRLLCGDSTNGADVDRLLAGITPRLMVTDPPYLVNYTGGTHHGAVDKLWSAYIDPAHDSGFYREFVAHAVRHLAPSAIVVQWHADRRVDLVREAWDHAGLFWHQTLYWVKASAVLTFADFMFGVEPAAYGWPKGHRPRIGRRPPRNMPNVWHLPAGTGLAEHPTVKPLQLYTDPYSWHLRAGEWAYEPFCGSGTAIAAAEITEGEGPPPDDVDFTDEAPPSTVPGTAIAAAEVTGRRGAALERPPGVVGGACRRWQQITGDRPVLERTGQAVDFEA